MEIVASVSKIMKHPRKIHFTRSTKAKNFSNRKSYVSIKSNRYHRFNSMRNSLKVNKNRNQEEINNFINNNETENTPFHRNYKPNTLENSLQLKINKSQELNLNNNGAENDSLEQSFLGTFTRLVPN